MANILYNVVDEIEFKAILYAQNMYLIVSSSDFFEQQNILQNILMIKVLNSILLK